MVTEHEATGLDPEVVEQIRKASKALKDLITSIGVEIDCVTSDWKQTEGHIREIAEHSQKHPGWVIYYFEPFYSFEDGGGDDHFTLLTSKPIMQELAVRLANLIYNLGADIE